MTKLDPKNEESRLDEIAAEWLFERDEGFAAGRAQAFQDWCNQDSRHTAAVARVERMLSLLDETPEFRESLEARLPQSGVPAKQEFAAAYRVVNYRRWAWAAGLAAALVIGTVGMWVAKNQPSTAVVFAADSMAPRRVALADGSVMDLNSKSNVQVKFSYDQRRITLAAGEAHFQVAHNAARPFVVTANGVSVRAIGTAFDVRLDGDKVEVLVTEGKVEVTRQGALWSRASTTPLVPNLSAGERTRVTSNAQTSPAVEEIGPTTMRTLLSWQDRMTTFVDVPLREMVARINRCNSIQLVLSDTELGDRRIGGVFALNQVDAFVQMLEQDGDVVVERRGTEILLRRSR